MKIEFLHIGLHKTASTWLQKVVFDQHPGLQVFHPATRINDSQAVLQRIFRTPAGPFDTKQWWDEFNRETADVDMTGRIAGLSFEILAGDMLHGRDVWVHAQRCRELFGPAKIILVLRHPVDYINSMYQQYVVQGGSSTLRMLLQDKNIPGREIAHKVDYQALIDVQHEVWSADHVLVLPFELMRDDRYDFLRRIWEFLDVETPADLDADEHVRESISGIALRTQRLLNALGIPMQQTRGRIRRLDERLLRKVVPGKYRASMEQILQWQPMLREVLKEENYCLWTDDLARYNYTFPSSGK